MTHAHAQADMADLPLEQLMQLQVTTASRYAQTALEAPATVSVVTADDIRLFGYRNLSEVLGRGQPALVNMPVGVLLMGSQ